LRGQFSRAVETQQQRDRRTNGGHVIGSMSCNNSRGMPQTAQAVSSKTAGGKGETSQGNELPERKRESRVQHIESESPIHSTG